MDTGSSEANYRPFALSVRVYGFPGVMVLLGVVPIGNALVYSAHGGLGWLALPLTFPYVLVRLGLIYSRSSRPERLKLRRFALVSVPIYVVVTAPLAWIATYSFNSWSGASLPWIQFWAAMLLPVSLLGLLLR
jgi:hypothetical protein